jgi:hypothetical protein
MHAHVCLDLHSAHTGSPTCFCRCNTALMCQIKLMAAYIHTAEAHMHKNGQKPAAKQTHHQHMATCLQIQGHTGSATAFVWQSRRHVRQTQCAKVHSRGCCRQGDKTNQQPQHQHTHTQTQHRCCQAYTALLIVPVHTAQPNKPGFFRAHSAQQQPQPTQPKRLWQGNRCLVPEVTLCHTQRLTKPPPGWKAVPLSTKTPMLPHSLSAEAVWQQPEAHPQHNTCTPQRCAGTDLTSTTTQCVQK